MAIGALKTGIIPPEMLLQTLAALFPHVRYGLPMYEHHCFKTGDSTTGLAMYKYALMSVLTIFVTTATAQGPVQLPTQMPLDEQTGDIINPIVEDPVQLEITEWPVPWEDTRPRDPDVAPNGVIWLVGQGGDYAARFDPETTGFRRKELPPGTGPHNLIIDRDGFLWIAGNRQAFIGRMNYVTGELTRYSMPDETARDPHTLVFSGRDDIWFTMQWSNYVGRLNKRSGHVDLVPMQTERARPYGIKMDSKGHPWIALLGTNGLATINPETLELEVVYLPRDEARLRRLAITRDDKIWYTDYNQGYIGRYDPETGEFTEWKTPSEKSAPYAMATDNLDRIWFVETWPQPNLLVGFDPLYGTFFSVTPIPSGGGSVRHMVYDPGRNSLWFGTDTNNLAQAVLP
jgi:virginiamycin B lyase